MNPPRREWYNPLNSEGNRRGGYNALWQAAHFGDRINRLSDDTELLLYDEEGELRRAFEEQSVLWTPEFLELSFPAGPMPAMEHHYTCSVALADLADILTDKALAGMDQK